MSTQLAFYKYKVHLFLVKPSLEKKTFLFPRHRLTRHQYYLQLRKDILEERLYCNEETGLFLVALALQAEFGDYMPEVAGTKNIQLRLLIPALSFYHGGAFGCFVCLF